MFLNCQGYLNNKNNIEILTLKWRPIIVCLSETHVTEDINASELKLHGYKTINCLSNNKRTGGVLVFIKDSLNYKLKHIGHKDYLWIIIVEVKLGSQKYLISTLYHPPAIQMSEFLVELEEILDQMCEFDGVIVCTGDFNFDWKKDSFYTNKCKNLIYRMGLNQVVKDFTRITKDSKTLIDYIVTNDQQLEHKVYHSPRISDHSILSIELNFQEDKIRK